MAWPGRDKEEREALEAKAKDWESKATASEQKQKDLEKKLSDLESERQREREVVKGMQTEFEKIKASVAEKEANRNAQDDKQVDFDDDPEKAFNQRLRPLADVTIQNAMQTSKILAQQQLDNQDMASGGKTIDGRLFRLWSGDITSEAGKYAPQQMIKPEAWLGIFYYVKGLKADELSNPEMRKQKYSFLESGGQGPPPPQEKKDDDKLTDEELRVCDRMGVKPENYLKQKKALKFVGA